MTPIETSLLSQFAILDLRSSKILSRLMLIHLPPRFEAATHARNVFESIVNQKRGCAETAVAVIAINNNRLILFRFLQKLLCVAVVQVKRPRNMRLAVRSGIANIDARTRSLIELRLGIMNLNLRDFHTGPLLTYSYFSIKPKLDCPQQQISSRIIGDG